MVTPGIRAAVSIVSVVVIRIAAGPMASLAGKEIELRELPGIERKISALETSISSSYENPGRE